MENHSKEFIQFLVNNDIEYSPVPTFAYRNREGVVPLWDVVDRRSPEYFRFEVRALPTDDDDDDNADFDNRSENCQWCHLCDVSVPIAFLTEHHASAKHLSCTAIAQSALQRLTKQLCVPPPAARPPRPHTYLCEQCACAVSVRRRDAHAQSAAHRSAVAHDRLLRALQAVYCDRSSAQQQYSALLRDGDDEMLRDSDDDGEERDSCDLPPAHGDGEKERQSVVKEDECVLETGKTFADVLRTPKVSQQDSKPENKKQLTVLTASGAVLRVDVNAYHGLYESPLGAACRLCGCNVYDKESHQLDAAHVRMLAQPARDLHGIRDIDSVWRHCMLCNETIDCRSVTSHVAGAKHVTCLERALVRPGDDTQPDVHVREEGLTRQDAAELLSHNSKTSDIQTAHHHVKKTKKAFKCLVCQTTLSKCDVDDHIQTVEHVNKFVDLLNDHLLSKVDASMLFCELCRIDVFVGDELNHIKQKGHLGARKVLGEISHVDEVKTVNMNEIISPIDVEPYLNEADGMYHIMQVKAEDNVNLEFKYTEIHTLNKHNVKGYIKHEDIGEIKSLDNISENMEDSAVKDVKLQKSAAQAIQSDLTVDIVNNEETNIDEEEKVNNTDFETKKNEVTKKILYPNNSKAHLINNRIVTHSDETYYCEICAVYIHKPALTDHLIRAKHKMKFRNEEEVRKYHKVGAGVHIPDDKEISEIIEFTFSISPDNKVKCIICDAAVPTTVHNFKDHFEGKKHKQSLSENSTRINTENDITRCHACDKTFPNSVEHFKMHTESGNHRGLINKNKTPNINDVDKSVDDNATQIELESYDTDDSFVSCKGSPVETALELPSTVTENISTNIEDDNLANDTDAATNVTAYEGSDTSETSNDSYIHNIDHLLTTTKKNLMCKICDCVLPFKTMTDIIEHFEGIQHTNKYESFLLSNMIRDYTENYSCEACNVVIPKFDIFDHIKTVTHQIMNKDPSTSEQTTRAGASNKDVQKMYDNFDITEILKHLFNVMNKIGSKEIHCRLCNSEMQHDFEYVERHVNSIQHKVNYATLLQEHEIKSVAGQISCEICQTKINKLEILEHIFGELHKANFMRNKLQTTKPNEYHCLFCDEKMENHLTTINLHNMSVSHMNNVLKGKKRVRYYNCEVCQIQMPRSQYHLHKNCTGHINKTLAATTTKGKVNTANTPKSKTISNIVNVQNPTNNSGQIKCKICNVYVPNHPANIDQHNGGNFHKENVKKTKAKQNKAASIETVSNNASGFVKCDICDVYITNNKMNIIVHNNSAAHKGNEMKAINAAQTQNSAANVTNNKYKCNVCEVDVPNNVLNIKQHNNGNYHKENLVLKAKNPTDKKLVQNGVCLVCNVKVPNSANCIKIHVNGSAHKKMAKEILERNKIEKAKTNPGTKATKSNNIKIINNGLCAFCTICSVSMLNESININGHVNSEKHKKNMIEYEAGIVSEAIKSAITVNEKHFCYVCEIDVADKDIKNHYEGLFHKTNIEKLRQRHISLYPSNNSTISRSSSVDTNISSSDSNKIYDNAIPSTSGITKKTTDTDNIVKSNDVSSFCADMQSKGEKGATKTIYEVTEKVDVKKSENELSVKKDANEKYDQTANKDTKVNLTKLSTDTDANDGHYLCTVCKHWIPNNTIDIKNHFSSFAHINAKTSLDETKSSNPETAETDNYFCEICKKNIPRNTIDLKRHEESAIHESNIDEIIKVNNIEVKDNKYCLCKLCNTYFTKRSVLSHVKRDSHIFNIKLQSLANIRRS